MVWALIPGAYARTGRVARGRGSPRPAAAVLLALDRITDEPEHRRPQPDEQRPALRVAALVLIDGLGADPQADAQADRPEPDGVEVPAAQARVVEGFGEH